MIHFEITLPTKEDAELICLWRNDPTALLMSFSYTKEKSVDEFFQEYIQNYFSFPNLPSVFAVLDGIRIGLLRFDPVDGDGFCEISLIVAPENRGHGYGALILQAIEPFLKRQGIQGIVALVKKENVASLKVFTKSGYTTLELGPIVKLEKILLPKQNQKVFVIAEVGSNWYVRGDKDVLGRCKALIDAAKEACADAVKFQVFQAKSTYVPNPGVSDYLSASGIKEDIFSLFEELEIPQSVLFACIEHAGKVGIEFMASVFSPRDFALIDPYVKRHKIASYEISYLDLIALAAKSKKPLILSTGASKPFDIDLAVKTFWQNGGQDLSLLQCTAKYPTDAKDMNLQVIHWLKSRYQVESGLSDHSKHPFLAPLAAVSLGASIIEKHFTLDRQLPGPDHAFAIEPDELKELVESIRQIELMRGSASKNILPCEQELYFFARRSIQALQDIQPGEMVEYGKNIGILRPGKRSLGAHPLHLKDIEGKKVKNKISQGEGVQLNDLENL